MNKVRKPEIARNQDMVGIRLPYEELDELVDAQTAIAVGQELLRLGDRLRHAHDTAISEALHMGFPNTEDGDADQATFIRDVMAARLRLNVASEA